MYIISFDIGEKNFAFSFIKSTKEENTIVFEVEDVNLYNVIEKQKQTIIESCCKISNILQTYDDKICTCSFILIEQQMRPNIRAQRISQHVWSYLYTKYVTGEKYPQIISVSSTLKTKMFTAEDLNKNQRKKWVTDLVLTRKIVNLAKVHAITAIISESVLKKIQELIKQDDVCDTIVQSLVFLIKNPKKVTTY
jgi:hypothetical protein